MNPKPGFTAFALLLAALGSSSLVTADTPAHYTAAKLLLDQITFCQSQGVFNDSEGVSINRYGGSWNSPTAPSFIQFADPDNNLLPGNNTKCSPLVTHIFKEIHGWNWRDYPFHDPVLNATKKTASPQAYQYCALIKQEIGFTRIPTLDAAQPGDILSWWRVGDSDDDHTMILDSINWSSAKPYLLGYPNSNPALAGTTYYEVTVIDSSMGTHTADTRMVNVGGSVQQIPGIGRGIIGVLVNAEFEIVGHTWSLPTSDYYTKPNTWTGSINTRLKPAPEWEFVIGRRPAQP